MKENQEFSLMGQKFYRGLMFAEIIETFRNKAELFDFLPNEKVLLNEKAEVCGIEAIVKVTFKNDLLESVYITAIGGAKIRRSGHRFILKRFFGESNAKADKANAYYEFSDFTAGDYLTANGSSFINIVFKNKTVQQANSYGKDSEN